MDKIFGTTPSEDAKNVLHLLKNHHNVIISGPPATGKSRLLSEIRYWFQAPSTPSFLPSGDSVFPSNQSGQATTNWHPSPGKTDRRVFQMTFHQGTKYRDFVSGLVPDTSNSVNSFKVVYGKFDQAAKHSITPDGASLLEIDELNRANTVSVFGDTITAIESDKRLLADGDIGPMTAVYSSLSASGELIDSNLSHHLYMIGAMNNADTSVQPLDVAFLRRWESYTLKPDEKVLRDFFSLGDNDDELNSSPSKVEDVFELMVRGWMKVNEGIGLLRGDDYKIGQGIFLKVRKDDLPTKIPEALEFALEGWNRLYAHLAEVFFGDPNGLANVLAANVEDNPYSIETKFFGGTSIIRIVIPSRLTSLEAYKVMLTIANAD